MGYLLCRLALNSEFLDFAASADPYMCEDAEMPEELGATSRKSRAERLWLDFKLSCRSVALAKFIVSQVYRIISHNMSYHPMLLCIFIFLLHYCDQLFFLAGHVSPMDPGQLDMGSGFSCYRSSSGLVGAYYAVFL